MAGDMLGLRTSGNRVPPRVKLIRPATVSSRRENCGEGASLGHVHSRKRASDVGPDSGPGSFRGGVHAPSVEGAVGIAITVILIIILVIRILYRRWAYAGTVTP